MDQDFADWYDDRPEPDWYESCPACGEDDDGYGHVCEAIDKHADRRDARRARDRMGMQMSGRSTKSVLLPLLGKERKNAR